MIKDIKLFEATILKSTFRATVYNSFYRQLNNYEFKKEKCYEETLYHQFSNPMFLKGRSYLMKYINRIP